MPRLPDFGGFTEPAVLILTSLARGPAHGYAIVKDVEELAGVHLGPGTLYAAISRLEARGLIEALEPRQRRRPYRITGASSSCGSAWARSSAWRGSEWNAWSRPDEAGVMRRASDFEDRVQSSRSSKRWGPTP